MESKVVLYKAKSGTLLSLKWCFTKQKNVPAEAKRRTYPWRKAYLPPMPPVGAFFKF